MPAVSTQNEFFQKFPETEYDVSHDVPIVDEYERPNGKKVGRDELSALIEKNNFRIEDTGDYVPLTIGHTSDDPDGPKPPVIGFAGPFKLARIGNKSPRWAMVAENWAIEKSALDQAKKNPRRSAEVWFNKDDEPQFIDPVSLLGATTPRRALGLKLSVEGEKNGWSCDRHEMAYASGSNTYQPGGNVRPQDELTAKVVNALEATDVFKWVRSKMAEDGAIDASMQGGDDDGDNDNSAIAGKGDRKFGSEKKPMADDKKDKNAADGGELTVEKLQLERDEYRDKFLAAEKELNQIRGSQSVVETRIAVLEKDKLQMERSSKLRDLIDAGWNVDLNQELADTADLNAEQFDRHIKRIERSYPRVPIGQSLPTPIQEKLSMDSATKEKNAKDAGDLVLRERAAGRDVSYADALKQVESKTAS